MLRQKRQLCTTTIKEEEEEEEEEEEDHCPKQTTIRRMSAATEASLDDIVHSYGGIRMIKMTGDNNTKSRDRCIQRIIEREKVTW